MAGHLFSRGFEKCPKCFILSRSVNAIPKLSRSSLRKLHTPSTRRLHVLSIFNHQPNTVGHFTVTSLQGTISYNVQASGLHISSADALPSGSLGSDILVDPAAIVASSDVFTSGIVEPTFTSLGLGSFWPPGLIQYAMEFTHTHGLPWWLTIVCGTILIRTMVLPLTIKGEVYTERVKSHTPEINRLKEQYELSKNRVQKHWQKVAKQEMQEAYKKHGLNPMNALWSPVVQMPLFISFYQALNGMCWVPVESLHTGGILWFTDLTIVDPYYILPIVSAGTMWLTVQSRPRIQMEAFAQLPKWITNNFRHFMCLFAPIMAVCFDIPAAMLLYWLATSTYSLCQVTLLQQTKVRRYYGLSKPTTSSSPLSTFLEKVKNPGSIVAPDVKELAVTAVQKKPVAVRKPSAWAYKEPFEYIPNPTYKPKYRPKYKPIYEPKDEHEYKPKYKPKSKPTYIER